METATATETDADNLPGLALKPAMQEWNQGGNEGSSDDSAPPPEDAGPEDAGRHHPHRERGRRDAKPFDEAPDFTETFGGKGKASKVREKAEESPAKEMPKAVRSDREEVEEPDAKPRRGTGRKAEHEQEEPEKGEVEGEAEEKEQLNKDLTEDADELSKVVNPRAADWRNMHGVVKAKNATIKQQGEAIRAKDEQLRAKEEEFRLYKQSLDEDDAPRIKEHNEVLLKENETLRSRVQREDYTTSKPFQDLYQAPADQQLRSVLDNVFRKRSDGSAESRQKFQTWAEEFWNLEHNPDPAVQKIAPALWMENVVNKLGDNPALRDEVLSGLQEYYRLKEARNQAADDAVRDPTKAHQQYIKHRQDYWARWDQGVQLGVADLEKEWAAWPELKDKEAAEALKKEMYPLVEADLKGLINEGIDPVELGRNQCRIAARASVFEYKFKQTEKELAQVTLERDEAQKELRRISKVRSVPLQAAGVGTRSRSRDEVNIFEDNPFKSGDAWKNSD
jgi:hypothetical protein